MFFLLVSISYGKDSLRDDRYRLNSIGATVNYLATKHFADFSQLPGVPSCCPKYYEASGNGLEFGLLYREYLSKTISFSPSVGMVFSNGLFKANEEKSIIIGNTPEKAIIEHSLLTEFMILYVEVNFNYNLFNDFEFFTSVSLDYITEAKFKQKETLIKPENIGSFENGKRTRNEISGKINDINKLNYFLRVGINYELPLNKRKSISILPGAAISAGLRNLLNDERWTLIHFTFGITILFNNYIDYSSPIDPKHRN